MLIKSQYIGGALAHRAALPTNYYGYDARYTAVQYKKSLLQSSTSKR